MTTLRRRSIDINLQRVSFVEWTFDDLKRKIVLSLFFTNEKHNLSVQFTREHNLCRSL